MAGLARIGDIVVGQCCCHSDPTCVPWTAVIVSGAATSFAEGAPLARMFDIAASCHTGILITGIPDILVEGLPVSELGSVTAGCGVGSVVTSAGTVMGG